MSRNPTPLLSKDALVQARGQGRADGTVRVPNGEAHSPYVRELIARGARETEQEGQLWAVQDGRLASAQAVVADRYREGEQRGVDDDGRLEPNHQPWRPGRAAKALIMLIAAAGFAGLAHAAVSDIPGLLGLGWVVAALVGVVELVGAYLLGALFRRVHTLAPGDARHRVIGVSTALALLLALTAAALGTTAAAGSATVTIMVLTLLLVVVVAAMAFADRPLSDGEREHKAAQDALVAYLELVKQRTATWDTRIGQMRAIRSRVPELVSAYYSANLQARRNSLTPEVRRLSAVQVETGDEPEWAHERPDFDPLGLVVASPAAVRGIPGRVRPRPGRRTARAARLGATVLTVTSGLLAAGPAEALPTQSEVAVFNASPAATIEARVDGQLLVGPLAYRSGSQSVVLMPGRHDVGVGVRGRVLGVNLELAAGDRALVVAWRDGDEPGLFAVVEPLPATPSGQAMVRLVNAIPGAPPLSLRDGLGRPIGEAASAGTSGYAALDPGTGPVDVVAGGRGAPVARTTLAAAAGSVYTLVVVGSAEAVPALVVVTDAVGLSRRPSGPPAAGGRSPAPPALPLAKPTLVAALLGAGLVAATRWRRIPTPRRVLPALALLTLAACGTRVPDPAQVLPPATTPTSSAPANHGRVEVAGVGKGGAGPVAILIPAFDIRADLLPVDDLDEASLATAFRGRDVRSTAAWYTGGPAPREVGPATIVAHIDLDSRRGAFYELGTGSIPTGTVVIVLGGDGLSTRFVVRDVRQYAKSRFPADVVWAPSSRPELRLVTCGGVFDARTGHYLDNVVAYASLEDVPP